jgi:hypothetical protein
VGPRIVGYARDVDLVFVYSPSGFAPGSLGHSEVVVLREPFRILVASTPLQASPRTGRVRPLVSGVSIGNALITAGTLGWFGKYAGRTVLISNAHVFTDRPESPSPPLNPSILQPGPIDGGIEPRNTVASYHSHVPVRVVEESTCPLSSLLVRVLNALSELLGRQTRFRAVAEPRNTVDAALATLRRGVRYLPAVMGDDGNPVQVSGKLVGLLFAGSGEYYVVSKTVNILSYYPGLELIGAVPADVKPGDRVTKCGRTTGCTEGEVVSADAVIYVRYPAGPALFEDVVIVRGRNAGGDSGSAVWLLP